MTEPEKTLQGEIERILKNLQESSVETIVNYDMKDEKIPDELRTKFLNATTWTQFYRDFANQQLCTQVKLSEKMDAWQKMCCYVIADKKGVDCDVALRTVVIYSLSMGLWKKGWGIIEQKDAEDRVIPERFELKKEGIAFTLRGDTMHSYETILHEYIQKTLDHDKLKNLKDCGIIEKYERNKFYYPKDYSCWEANILAHYETFEPLLTPAAKEFIPFVHTAGNFIPAPSEFSTGRGVYNIERFPCDYLDLALLAIYHYYHEASCAFPFSSLRWLVGSMEKVKQVQAWLNSFGCWDQFVERNYFQPFVSGPECGPYGCPHELWDGHFTGEIMPQRESDFEQFFVNARIRILKRGQLIADAVKEKLAENSNLNKLAEQMVTGGTSSPKL